MVKITCLKIPAFQSIEDFLQLQEMLISGLARAIPVMGPAETGMICSEPHGQAFEGPLIQLQWDGTREVIVCPWITWMINSLQADRLDRH